MNKLLDLFVFALVYYLSVKIIEYRGDFIIDLAGDFFGCFALMALGVIFFNKKVYDL